MGGASPKGSGEWPWLALLFIYYETRSSICGATLIDHKYLVTAAHCFDTYESTGNITKISIWMGVDRTDLVMLQHTEEYLQEEVGIIHQTVTLKNVKIHEGYDGAQFNDIALIKLEYGLDNYNLNTPLIRPACLPNGEKPSPGQKCWVAGWGQKFSLEQFEKEGNNKEIKDLYSSKLLEIPVNIGQTKDCKRGMAKSHKDYYAYTNAFQPDRMFCAGMAEGEIDACQGDSGGGLICQRCDSCNFYVAGVISFGAGCGIRNRYSIFTDVNFHESWIKENTKILPTKDMKEYETCQKETPPVYSLWSEWSDCQINKGASCGEGKQFRFRTCNLSDPQLCQNSLGDAQESRSCEKTGDSCRAKTACKTSIYLDFDPDTEKYSASEDYREFSGVYYNVVDRKSYRHENGVFELTSQYHNGKYYWVLYSATGARIAYNEVVTKGNNICPNLDNTNWHVQVLIDNQSTWVKGDQFTMTIREHATLPECPIEIFQHNFENVTHFEISSINNYFSVPDAKLSISREIVQGEYYWVVKDNENHESYQNPKGSGPQNIKLHAYLKTANCIPLDTTLETANWHVWKNDSWIEICDYSKPACKNSDSKNHSRNFYLSWTDKKISDNELLDNEIAAKCNEIKTNRASTKKECDLWAKDGYCPLYTAFMLTNCLKDCCEFIGLPEEKLPKSKSDPDCEDKSTYCAGNENYCQNPEFKDWMAKFCPATCKLCKK